MARTHQELNKILNFWVKINKNFVTYENKSIVGFYIIKPRELSSDSPIMRLSRLNGFAALAKQFNDEHACTFYALSDLYDFSYQANKVKKQTDHAKKGSYLEKLGELYHTKFEQLSSEQGEIREKIYVMCIRGHNEYRIAKFYTKLVKNISRSGFECIAADKDDIFKIFNRFYQLPESNRNFTLKNCEIGFKHTSFQINHFDHIKKSITKKYCRIINLMQMPKAPIDFYWLESTFNVNDVIVSYAMESLDEKKRNNFIERLSSDFLNVRTPRSKVRALEVDYNRMITEHILNDIARGIQDIKFVRVSIMIYADSIEQLKIKYQEVKHEIESFGGQSYDMNFRQREMFTNMQPFGWGGWNKDSDNFNKDVEIVLPTDAIGYSYPITQTSFIDADGSYIGLNGNLTPILVDPTNRRKRSSGNMCIFGMTGSRKSTLVKIQILQWLIHPKVEKTLVLDWEGEYIQLAKNLHQLILTFDGSGDENTPTINMWEIPKASRVEGNETFSSRTRYQKHIQALKRIITCILLEDNDRFSSDESTTLLELINLAYASKNIYAESNYDKLNVKDWPTLDTLFKITQNEIKRLTKSKHEVYLLGIYQKISRLLRPYISGGGLDGLFNRHTNVDLNNDYKLIVFNLYGLLDSTSTNIQRAMTMLVINYFNREMIEHRKKFPRENDPNATFINFVVDEFHKLVDDNDDFMLKDVAAKYQQVRKYYCNYIVATPSLTTFTRSKNTSILKHTQIILNNSMYKFILSMSEDELEHEINEKLFASTNRITYDEIEFLSDISENDAGKFVMITNTKDRILGRIDSGNKIAAEDFNVPVDQITEIAQLWGTPS